MARQPIQEILGAPCPSLLESTGPSSIAGEKHLAISLASRERLDCRTSLATWREDSGNVELLLGNSGMPSFRRQRRRHKWWWHASGDHSLPKALERSPMKMLERVEIM